MGLLCIYDKMELFDKGYLKVQKDNIVVNSFESTGIYPFNRNVFSEKDFIAASLHYVEAENISLTGNSIPGQE